MIIDTPKFHETIEEMWRRARRISAEGRKPEVRNCHYMPEFLMRRWATNGMLCVVETETGEERKLGLKQVGAIKDFYTTEAPAKKPDRRLVESFLERTETETGKILATLSKKNWELSKLGKETLALFLAVMIVRLPVVLTAITNDYLLEWKSEWGKTDQGNPHPGNFVYRLLNNAEPFTSAGPILASLANCFYHRHVWTLVKFGPNCRIQTGDNPISLNSGNQHLHPERWQIRMPLDPYVLLTTNNTFPDGLPYPEGTCVADPSVVLPDWNANGMRFRIR